MTCHVNTVVKVTINSYIRVPTDPGNWNRESREINPTPNESHFWVVLSIWPEGQLVIK